MRLMFLFLFSAILCLFCVIGNSQNLKPKYSQIGDAAPPLLIKNWLKGTSFNKFKKGTTYVVEFWATWCIPCKAVMPHLSVLANTHKKNVVFLAVNILEKKNTPLQSIKKFVDSMGNKMDYNVAIEKTKQMENKWLVAFDERKNGIPITFVINSKGKVAWIGYPTYVDTVLDKIVNATYDIKKANEKRNLGKYLQKLDRSHFQELMKYNVDTAYSNIDANPDSFLLAIENIVLKEPRLKYAPLLSIPKFYALLKKDQQLAYEYGKIAINTAPYGDDPPYDKIIYVINTFLERNNLSQKIYLLGAEAYQVKVDNIYNIQLSDIYDMDKYYAKMVEWYTLAGEVEKANIVSSKIASMMK